MWHCEIKYFLIPQLLYVFFLLLVVVFLFYFLGHITSHKGSDLSDMDETLSPCSASQIKHWTAKEIPDQIFLFFP